MRRKPTWWMSRSAIVLFIIAFCLWCSYLVYRRLEDDPPPDDSDLLPEILDIPESENAFYYIKSSYEKYDWPEGTDKDKAENIADGIDWDPIFANELINKNKEALKLIEKAITCESSEVEEMGVGTLLPYFPAYRRAQHLLAICARSLFNEGKEKEAFDEVMRIIKFGNMVKNGGGGMMFFIAGARIEQSGGATLREFLKNTTLNLETLKSYIEQLREHVSDNKALLKSLKNDYVMVRNSIDTLAEGKLELAHFIGGTITGKKTRPGYLFKPEATKKLIAELYRAAIENLDRNFSELRDVSDISSFFEDDETFRAKRNGTGKMIAERIASELARFDSIRFKFHLSYIMTEVYLALKCYKLQYGELPDSLEELVPEFLDKVPEDPYDGKPLRYSKEDKMIHSVGEEMKSFDDLTTEECIQLMDPRRDVFWSLEYRLIQIEF